MFRSRIFWKLTGAVVCLILVSSATIWAVALPRVEAHALDQVERSLRHQAALVLEPATAALAHADLPAVRRSFARLAMDSGTRFTVIDRTGVVLVDTREDPGVMENHGKRPEILLAAETGGPARSIRSSRTLGRDMMYLAAPVEDLGFIRTSVDLSDVEARRGEVRRYILSGAALAAGLALLLGLFLSRRFTGPLLRMKDAAEAVAAGDVDVHVEVHSKDELGQLAESLQEMSVQLADRMMRLATERNELRAILGSMLEGVVAVDRDERIVHINGNAARVLECDPVTSIGKRVWEVSRVHPVSETISAVLADQSEITREAKTSIDQRERVLEMIASPLRGGMGELAGAVVVLHDVTELRRLERVRRDFVVNVSHELKTPLTAIRGFVETMMDDPEIDPETRAHFLSRTNEQTLRLTTLVSDLLVLSRVESEDDAIERRPVDLRRTLSECAHRHMPGTGGRNLSLEAVLPESPVMVFGDEESLRQVVDNLLDNALKYTPEGGRVELRLTVEDGLATIEVEDTGIGIDAGHLDRIFERFYRVDKARSRELGGTGLGLSIVKHIVGSHGGRVSVRSDPGRGSTFRVALPIHVAG
jgi:two-component system phosphate regulon sensor histidine kinase PhoR